MVSEAPGAIRLLDAVEGVLRDGDPLEASAAVLVLVGSGAVTTVSVFRPRLDCLRSTLAAGCAFGTVTTDQRMLELSSFIDSAVNTWVPSG